MNFYSITYWYQRHCNFVQTEKTPLDFVHNRSFEIDTSQIATTFVLRNQLDSDHSNGDIPFLYFNVSELSWLNSWFVNLHGTENYLHDTSPVWTSSGKRILSMFVKYCSNIIT